MKVIYNGQQVSIEDNVTLEQFVGSQGGLGQTFLLNGTALSPDTILESYNVIETDPSGTLISSGGTTSRVDVDLTDFTGHSGIISVDNSVESVRSRYDGAVAISVIRDNQPIQTNDLQTGDRVMVMPSGGVKGA